MTLIGIDTGGTFTDFVLWRDGVLSVHKVLSTPGAPELAILRGIQDLGLDPAQLRVVHGSTVATNAVLEGKGVRTLYLTNRGLEDLLTIGRQARTDLYDLQPRPRCPPVPPDLCVGTGGRRDAQGLEVEPLTDADLCQVRQTVARLAPESVAINLLFSYLDDGAERALVAALPAECFVSRSSEVLPIAGEYERGIATWLNAWVGPVVARYLERLGSGLPGAQLAVMQSSGESIAAGRTARQAVRLLLSGPAGGLAGAAFVAGLGAERRLLSFDMGGTSTDVAALDGEPRLTGDGRIAGYPVALPMVDLHTIGAGGGSIARVDGGGLLLVGPESAGADPGPACYGRGGTLPTVTDANLILGRLDPQGFLAGRMPLDVQAARAALAPLAERLGLDLESTAAGIVRLADEHMARALRVISVERGLDPRDFTLASFGGAGGLHVCALAQALAMDRALVPIHSGVLSALGMLVAPAGRTLTRSWIRPLAELRDLDIQAALDDLAAKAAAELAEEGWDVRDASVQETLGLRYLGQSSSLDLPWRGIASTLPAFHGRHESAYGHRLGLPVELVNLRVRVRMPPPALSLPLAEPGGDVGSRPLRSIRAHGCAGEVEVLARGQVAADGWRAGPLVIVDEVATLWVAPGWQVRSDAYGNLWLQRLHSAQRTAGAGRVDSV